jgi:SET and MYND domain-containing protein 4
VCQLHYSVLKFLRSAALFQMKLYEDCIKDVDRALALGYPKSQEIYSLHLRKAKCLKFLGKDYAECVADAIKVCI